MATRIDTAAMSRLGIVVIGRNEGERLVRCLKSLADNAQPLVYVDSGSNDGSQGVAERAGAVVLALDTTIPFTAARARNTGAAALPSECEFIQFVDGDCIVQPGWTTTGQAALAADTRLGAVFGRVREIHPDASIYNWLCNIEWAVPPGPSSAFAGNVMLRRTALKTAGGYPETMIAGEEPELSIRMRALGWGIHCLPREMALHDAAITRFGQWWRRAIRSGHAFAALVDRHRGSPLQNYGRNVVSALVLGATVPLSASVMILVGIVARSTPLIGLGLAIATLPIIQTLRITLRERRNRPLKDSAVLAFFLMLAKPAEAIGIVRYWYGRISGHRSRIIEYKDVPLPPT
jgi:GT2 family glycosyltransferase